MTRSFPRTFLVAPFRSPQVPSRSSPSLSIRSRKVTLRVDVRSRISHFPHVRTRKDTLGQISWGVSTDRYSGPIGRLSPCRSGWRLSRWQRSHSSVSNTTSPTLKRAACYRADDGTPMICPPSASRRPVGSRPPGHAPDQRSVDVAIKAGLATNAEGPGFERKKITSSATDFDRRGSRRPGLRGGPQTRQAPRAARPYPR